MRIKRLAATAAVVAAALTLATSPASANPTPSESITDFSPGPGPEYSRYGDKDLATGTAVPRDATLLGTWTFACDGNKLTGSGTSYASGGRVYVSGSLHGSGAGARIYFKASSGSDAHRTEDIYAGSFSFNSSQSYTGYIRMDIGYWSGGFLSHKCSKVIWPA